MDIIKYKKLMDEAMIHYNTEEEYKQYFGRVPLFRYDTLKYCLDYFTENNFKTIVELGTSRSFVDGKYPGCNSDDTKYWEPSNPIKWDWSAGCFTRVIGELIQNSDVELTSVDLALSHINRSKKMTEGLTNITHFNMSSEEYLINHKNKIDFLYMDTGDVTPIERTAELHLRESKILVENDIMSPKGILLIDDVRNIQSKKQTTSEYGKAKYSIPYLQENGYELVMDEYQVVLIKK